MYNNIFRDIKSRSHLSIYENQFKAMTSQEYKQFLFNTFITDNKTRSYIAKLLGTSESVIVTHLQKYGIKKEYIVDTSNMMHKTPTMIEKETGRKFIDVYNELYEQGLSQTEITIKLQIKNVSSVSKYLNAYYKAQQKKLNPPDESKLIIKGLSRRNASTVERMFREQLGIEYKDFLKQKYIDEGLNLDEISELVGISPSALSERMKEYGFTKSLSQMRKESIEKGNINYEEILSKSRKTRNKSKSNSHTQDLLITLIRHQLEYLFNELNDIEIILGYNEYCILGSLEIDIPIVIIKPDKLYKIALEYNGEVWHDVYKHNDSKKEILLKQKGWHLIKIHEDNAESGKLGILEDKAKFIVNQISKIIKSN